MSVQNNGVSISKTKVQFLLESIAGGRIGEPPHGRLTERKPKKMNTRRRMSPPGGIKAESPTSTLRRLLNISALRRKNKAKGRKNEMFPPFWILLENVNIGFKGGEVTYKRTATQDRTYKKLICEFK